MRTGETETEVAVAMARRECDQAIAAIDEKIETRLRKLEMKHGQRDGRAALERMKQDDRLLSLAADRLLYSQMVDGMLKAGYIPVIINDEVAGRTVRWRQSQDGASH